jgi:hypothetical protein
VRGHGASHRRRQANGRDRREDGGDFKRRWKDNADGSEHLDHADSAELLVAHIRGPRHRPGRHLRTRLDQLRAAGEEKYGAQQGLQDPEQRFHNLCRRGQRRAHRARQDLAQRVRERAAGSGEAVDARQAT